MIDPEEVLSFWLDEVGPDGWYARSEEIDAGCRRFERPARLAARGAYDRWLLKPRSALALMILLDQIPRNLHRDRPEAFAGDARALAMAKRALVMGLDRRIDEPERQFFYLPLMHAECLADQERCVRLILTRMPRTGADSLGHARAHREAIRRFGRFPGRNAALGRDSTPAEREWLAAGGYHAMVKDAAAR